MVKSICGRDISTATLIVTLFTITKSCSQPQCPPTNTWVEKAGQIRSAIRNEILSFVTIGIDMDDLQLGKISKKHKGKYCLSSWHVDSLKHWVKYWPPEPAQREWGSLQQDQVVRSFCKVRWQLCVIYFKIGRRETLNALTRKTIIVIIHARANKYAKSIWFDHYAMYT